MIEAQDLRSDNYAVDPYVEIYFGKQSSKTKTASNTLSPVWNEYTSLYIKYIFSFVDDEDDAIKIAVMNFNDSETPLGICSKFLPRDENYEQNMITEWIPLTSVNGNKGYGKIRLGVQYIYDQVKFMDAYIDKREEEYKNVYEENEYTKNNLKETFEPFNVIIHEEEEPKLSNDTNSQGMNTFDQIGVVLDKPLEITEDFLIDKVSYLRPSGMKWIQLFKISGIAYGILAILISFHNTNVINVRLL